ncbi:calcium homeostasis modulator protein 6-like [Zootoca vivipara]|uniref:calcium homeostasis modulator protein 6-like n=1 Tax=Zootoca vivipara TaxID=8524 RepID=UPI001592581A|nr:calcium homeostasis modulator protein 6-like [Zootoca vivipara]
MEKFRTVFDFFLNHQKALGYGAVSLLTVGSERIFSAVVFKCPCNSWNMLYGLVFLLVPALILFLLGLLLSSQSWKILTGSCAPNRLCKCPHGTRFRHYLKVLWLVTIRASAAPLTWIAVALLGSRFYECAATGSPIMQAYMCEGKGDGCVKEMLQVPCQSGTLTSEMQDVLMSLQAQSQVLGWILIASVFILALVSTCISRCCSPVSILQLAFWKVYIEQERQLFEQKAKDHAAKLAERNVRCFFDSTELGEFQTPSAKEWHGISSLFKFNPKKDYYSMMHKYVSSKTNTGSIGSVEGDTVPCCLGFVDGAGGIETQGL